MPFLVTLSLPSSLMFSLLYHLSLLSTISHLLLSLPYSLVHILTVLHLPTKILSIVLINISVNMASTVYYTMALHHVHPISSLLSCSPINYNYLSLFLQTSPSLYTPHILYKNHLIYKNPSPLYFQSFHPYSILILILIPIHNLHSF